MIRDLVCKRPFLKPSSGIGRGRGKRRGQGINRLNTSLVEKMSKSGDMPNVNLTRNATVKEYEAVFETIDKYYTIPSDTELRRLGIQVDDSWHMHEIYIPDPAMPYSSKTVPSGKYELVKTLRANLYDGIHSTYGEMHAPIGTSISAHEGHLKYSIYLLLRRIGKLNKTQFMRSKG